MPIHAENRSNSAAAQRTFLARLPAAGPIPPKRMGIRHGEQRAEKRVTFRWVCRRGTYSSNDRPQNGGPKKGAWDPAAKSALTAPAAQWPATMAVPRSAARIVWRDSTRTIVASCEWLSVFVFGFRPAWLPPSRRPVVTELIPYEVFAKRVPTNQLRIQQECLARPSPFTFVYCVFAEIRSINGDPGNGLRFPERVSENRPKVRTFVLVPCEDERHMDC